MTLQELHIINFKNIREADLTFADKLNCFVGLNGQGKTNLLDAIYYLSFTKSAFNTIDSQNILHDADFAMIQGIYAFNNDVVASDAAQQHKSDACLGSPQNNDSRPFGDPIQVTCAIKRGQKKQFRCGKKDYQRMLDHIGRIPLVMVSPEDNQLIAEGSDERRRFLDVIIGQTDRAYLEHLSLYNALVKQRNALLKQYAESSVMPEDLFEVLEHQMLPHAMYIFEHRRAFVEAFVPVFAELYKTIADVEEEPRLTYRSQLFDRDLGEALQRTRSRDIILGWTSQGVHKDELEMQLGDYPLRRVGSQGQQKTYLIALKLAQALYLSSQQPMANGQKPILLLDDIFDKLDAERVSRIVSLVRSDRFGQIFLTDTDRQHLTDIVRPIGELGDGVMPLGSSKVFYVSGGDFRAG
ncbi:MAG: DNA replication and repair protein RecF [Paludibacteraceae bacterium]|nr:DNA replication and repair protein RecF [Paludibacteraceae bacterium]